MPQGDYLQPTVNVPGQDGLQAHCPHQTAARARFAGTALRPVEVSCDLCGGRWRTTDPVPVSAVMGVWVPPVLHPERIDHREVIGSCGYGQLLRASLTMTLVMPQLCDLAVVLAAWELACTPTLEQHDATDLLTSWMDGGPETLYQVAQSLVMAKQSGLVQPLLRRETRPTRLGDVHPTRQGWAIVQELEPLPWACGPRSST